MSNIGHVGRYGGINYKRQRICDVMAVDTKARWYFIYADSGQPTGNHYRTLAEMRRAIDTGEEDAVR